MLKEAHPEYRAHLEPPQPQDKVEYDIILEKFSKISYSRIDIDDDDKVFLRKKWYYNECWTWARRVICWTSGGE